MGGAVEIVLSHAHAGSATAASRRHGLLSMNSSTACKSYLGGGGRGEGGGGRGEGEGGGGRGEGDGGGGRGEGLQGEGRLAFLCNL